MHARSRDKREVGAVVVEFALVAPLLIGLFIAIIEFSYIWNFRSQLNNATLSAARYYATPRSGMTTAAMQTKAESVVSSGVMSMPSVATYTFCVDGSCGSSAQCPTAASSQAGIVTLTVTTEPNTLTRVFGKTFTVTTKAVVPCG